LTLDQVPSGARVFIDSTIFLYHFTGASSDCRRFLERCERGEIKGLTSVLVMAEVAHRLMMIEAVARELISPGNVVKKLRDKPEIVRKLHVYQTQMECIPLMGIDVISIDLKALMRSAEYRRTYGLLTNDSLVATAAVDLGPPSIASADSDFKRVLRLKLFRPSDID
jgi:predicted nucleic acid-binding protein